MIFAVVVNGISLEKIPVVENGKMHQASFESQRQYLGGFAPITMQVAAAPMTSSTVLSHRQHHFLRRVFGYLRRERHLCSFIIASAEARIVAEVLLALFAQRPP